MVKKRVCDNSFYTLTLAEADVSMTEQFHKQQGHMLSLLSLLLLYDFKMLPLAWEVLFKIHWDISKIRYKSRLKWIIVWIEKSKQRQKDLQGQAVELQIA